MALKDHTLDDRIVRAARAEFLEKGYRGAAVQQIAERAGITTGALYTRYKNKDELFCSLVQEVLEEVRKHGEPLRSRYMEAQASGDPRKILGVIREEERIYQELLFSHHEACVLLFCRSEGSSLELLLRTMMEKKAQETVDYLRTISRSDMDLDGVGLLMSAQFNFFRQILERGYDREKALACMKTVECYMDAGWEALFEAIL